VETKVIEVSDEVIFDAKEVEKEATGTGMAAPIIGLIASCRKGAVKMLPKIIMPTKKL